MKTDLLTGLVIFLGALLLGGMIIFSWFSNGNEDTKKEPLKQETSIIDVQQSQEGSSNELPSSLIPEDETIQLNEEIEVAGGYSYTQTDLDNSKETALKFIEEILPFDSKKPLFQLENKELLQWAYSETLDNLKTIIEDGTEQNIYYTKNVFKRTLDTLEVVESEFYHTDEMYINVLANTNTTFQDGTSKREEYFYNVVLVRNMEGDYKVSSIYRFD